MRKTHYVFIGVCIVWVVVCSILFSTSPHTKELWDKQDMASNLGQTVATLIYPSIGYGIYSLIRFLTSKPKQKNSARNSEI